MVTGAAMPSHDRPISALFLDGEVHVGQKIVVSVSVSYPVAIRVKRIRSRVCIAARQRRSTSARIGNNDIHLPRCMGT